MGKNVERGSKLYIYMIPLNIISLRFMLILQNCSISTLRNVVDAFQKSVDTEDKAWVEDTVINPDMQKSLMTMCLLTVPNAMKQYLPSKNGKSKDTTALTKLGALRPIVKTFLTAYVKVLTTFTDADTIRGVLRAGLPILPYMSSFPKLGKRFLQRLLLFWVGQDMTLRVAAFLVIRQMATMAPFTEPCLRSCLQQYLSVAKEVNVHTLQLVSYLEQCLIELYGVDPCVAYQCAFVAVRHVALDLRQAITTRSRESRILVYSQQTVMRLALMGKVLQRHYGSSTPMRHLLLPYVQTVLAVIQLLPSVQYFPLRLRCASMLNDVATASNSFIPIASTLLPILNSTPLLTHSEPSTAPPIDLSLAVKMPSLRTSKSPALKSRYTRLPRHVVASLLDESVWQLARHYAHLGSHIAFPEACVASTIAPGTHCKAKHQSTRRHCPSRPHPSGQRLEPMDGRTTCQTSPLDPGDVNAVVCSFFKL